MSCERYAEAIVDHACGADLAADAAAHLRDCARCAAMFDQQRRALGDLDRELQAALAIEPTVQFAPRVRAAVESAPARSGRGAMVWWVGLAAAAVVVAIAGSFMVSPVPPAPAVARGGDPAPPVTTPRIHDSVPDTRPDTVHDSVSDTKPDTRPGTVHDSVSDTEPDTRPEPEIIVAADQALAVARYVALVRSGRLETSALAATAPDELTPPSDLVVGPLNVEPIAIPRVDSDTNPAVDRRQE